MRADVQADDQSQGIRRSGCAETAPHLATQLAPQTSHLLLPLIRAPQPRPFSRGVRATTQAAQTFSPTQVFAKHISLKTVNIDYSMNRARRIGEPKMQRGQHSEVVSHE